MIDLNNLPPVIAQRIAQDELKRRGVSLDSTSVPHGIHGMAALVWRQENAPNHPIAVLGRLGREQMEKDKIRRGIELDANFGR